MFRVLQLGLSDAALEGALLSAIAWTEPAVARPAITQLCSSDVPSHRRIGLRALVAHRLDATPEIERAAHSPDPSLRALAFRAAGETHLRELTSTAERALHDPEALCRFWAGWCLALFGDADAAKAAFEAGWPIPAVRDVALEVAARRGEPKWVQEVVRSLAVSPATRREAIRALGMLGDPIAVPWLLLQLDDPIHGRIAGEAFSMITGVDLEFLDLNDDPPEEAEGGVEIDPHDSNLPLPNSGAVNAWWHQHRSRFSESERYLAGQPISPTSARTVLREGYQRQRAAAAFELACLDGSVLFPVDSRADWQQRRLAS